MEPQRHSTEQNGSRTPSQSNVNVFDDEFAVESPGSGNHDFNVADGLRVPSGDAQSESKAEQSAQATPGADSTSQNAAESSIQPRASIHKPRISYGQGDDRYASVAFDSGAAATGATTAQTAAAPHRAVSSASSYAPTDRGQSPTPLSQPTHPYGLYQQSTGVARTPSMATESTARPLSTITSSQRPTHPYGLYSQNGVDEDAESSAPPQSAVPVGFPGRGDGFHRRIGPDGEEQDIVGPDGHTEQLPPYSKYPEHGPAKMAVPVTVPSRDSEPASSADVSPTSTGSEAQIVPDAANTSEKAWNEKTWKEKRRTKFCGGRLPCWMLAFIVVCIIVIIGLIAGLIGGLLSAEHKSHNNNVVTTTLFDASLISAPSGVPLPPNGEWALPLGIPKEQQVGCLANGAQQAAWTCAVNGPPLKVNLSIIPPGSKSAGSAWLGDIDPEGSTYSYGTQPPCVGVSQMQWVMDLDDQDLGPALHFQAYYDKQVIVPQSKLSTSSSKRARQAAGDEDGPDFDDWDEKSQVQAGDQPWLCFWNQTFLEGFIYMEKDSKDAASQSSVFASWSSAFAAATAAAAAPDSWPTGMGPGGGYNHRARDYDPDDDDSSYGNPYAGSTTKPTNEKSTSTPSPTPTSAPSSTITTTSSAYDHSVYTYVASDSGTTSSYPIPTLYPLFPYIVKVEERRVSQPDNSAYCTLMQLLNDGRLEPKYYADNPAGTIHLTESDPSMSDWDTSEPGAQTRRKTRVKRYRRMWDHSVFEREVPVLEERDEPSDSCHCQWQNS